MKMLIPFLLLSLVYQKTNAQNLPVDSSKYDLWKKGNSQRVAGCILLGAGAITTIIGVANATSNFWENIIEGENRSNGQGATIAGLVMMVGSIPLFISAGKNKRASLAVINVPQWQMNTGLLTLRSTPQLSLILTKQIF